MSSIMRRRSGLISAIGNLLSEGLGFDTHDPLRQQAITATAPQPPRQRLRSIPFRFLPFGIRSNAIELPTRGLGTAARASGHPETGRDLHADAIAPFR